MSQVGALQEALRTEYQVIYGYGVVGAHLTGAAEDYAADRLTAHQERRDKLSAMISALGGNPVASKAAYELPFPVTGPAGARRLGAHLELGAADAAWDLIAATAGRSAARTFGVAWMTDAASSAALWGGTQPLPGQPVAAPAAPTSS